MNKKKTLSLSPILLLIIGLVIYSCADKEIETEPISVATTRAEGVTFQSKYYTINRLYCSGRNTGIMEI